MTNIQRASRDRKNDVLNTNENSADVRGTLLGRLGLQDRHVELAGIRTSVIETGAGRPMVLLHGPGEFGLTWMRVIPELARNHRIIVPDLPGHGESGLPDADLDVPGVVQWLDALIDETCTEPPILVGHLLGGAIAARYAASREANLNRVVLVDSYGLSKLWPSPKFSVAMARFIIHPTVGSQRAMMDRCMFDLDGLRSDMDGDLDMLEAYGLAWAELPKAKVALRAMMPSFAMPAIPEADLKSIKVPVNLIWGREDLQISVRVAERASEHYGWPLHVIENCADDPAIEQPESFLRALLTDVGTT